VTKWAQVDALTPTVLRVDVPIAALLNALADVRYVPAIAACISKFWVYETHVSVSRHESHKVMHLLLILKLKVLVSVLEILPVTVQPETMQLLLYKTTFPI